MKNYTIRRMRPSDWPTVIDLVHRIWYADDNFEGRGANLEAAIVDTRLLLKDTTFGFLVLRDGALLGFLTGRGPKPPTLREQGWHEVAVAKALESAAQISPEAGKKIAELENYYRTYDDPVRDLIPTFDGRLTLLLLDPVLRGEGVGRELLDLAIAKWRELGSTSVYLNTDSTMNYQFYEHTGWKLEMSYQLPPVEDIMSKNVTEMVYWRLIEKTS